MHQSLVHLFLDSANRYPDKEAVIHGDRRVNYGTLAHWVNSISAFLVSEGLARTERVGVLVRNSPEYIAIYYGILAAGGAVVALNTDTKFRDLSGWLRHSESTWLFADPAHPQYRQLKSELGNTLRFVESGMRGHQDETPGSISLAGIISAVQE